LAKKCYEHENRKNICLKLKKYTSKVGKNKNSNGIWELFFKKAAFCRYRNKI
jgi:hypothetical protein